MRKLIIQPNKPKKGNENYQKIQKKMKLFGKSQGADQFIISQDSRQLSKSNRSNFVVQKFKKNNSNNCILSDLNLSLKKQQENGYQQNNYPFTERQVKQAQINNTFTDAKQFVKRIKTQYIQEQFDSCEQQYSLQQIDQIDQTNMKTQSILLNQSVCSLVSKRKKAKNLKFKLKRTNIQDIQNQINIIKQDTTNKNNFQVNINYKSPYLTNINGRQLKKKISLQLPICFQKSNQKQKITVNLKTKQNGNLKDNIKCKNCENLHNKIKQINNKVHVVLQEIKNENKKIIDEVMEYKKQLIKNFSQICSQIEYGKKQIFSKQYKEQYKGIDQQFNYLQDNQKTSQQILKNPQEEQRMKCSPIIQFNVDEYMGRLALDIQKIINQQFSQRINNIYDDNSTNNQRKIGKIRRISTFCLQNKQTTSEIKNSKQKNEQRQQKNKKQGDNDKADNIEKQKQKNYRMQNIELQFTNANKNPQFNFSINEIIKNTCSQ